MHNIPIAFTFDKRIILAASVAIKSLIESANKTTKYEIKILHSDLDLKTQKHLTQLTQNTQHAMSFHYIDKDIFSNLQKSKGSWQEVVYYRLYIPEIISSDKVIYSDVDVYFKDDLWEVFSSNIENYEIGAVKAEINSDNAICHKYFKENKNDFIYWSGFLLLNCKKLKKENFFEKFMQTAKDFNGKLKFFDLDVLNITCNKILNLSLKNCVLEPIIEFSDFAKMKDYEYLSKVYSDEEIKQAKQNPTIIHYAGELGKPWRRKNTPKYYQETINKLPKELKKYTFRDIRKKLFSKG